MTKFDELKILCERCGSLIKVLVFHDGGNEDREQYQCPECGKEHRAISALPPRAKVINRRLVNTSMQECD